MPVFTTCGCGNADKWTNRVELESRNGFSKAMQSHKLLGKVFVGKWIWKGDTGSDLNAFQFFTECYILVVSNLSSA